MTDCFDHARHLGETREVLVLTNAGGDVHADEGQLLRNGEVGGSLEGLARDDAEGTGEEVPVHGVEDEGATIDRGGAVGRGLGLTALGLTTELVEVGLVTFTRATATDETDQVLANRPAGVAGLEVDEFLKVEELLGGVDLASVL